MHIQGQILITINTKRCLYPKFSKPLTLRKRRSIPVSFSSSTVIIFSFRVQAFLLFFSSNPWTAGSLSNLHPLNIRIIKKKTGKTDSLLGRQFRGFDVVDSAFFCLLERGQLVHTGLTAFSNWLLDLAQCDVSLQPELWRRIHSHKMCYFEISGHNKSRLTCLQKRINSMCQ